MEDVLPEVSIRTATPADADRIAAVHVTSWRAAYRGVVAEEYLAGIDVERRAELWRQTLSGAANPGTRAWVAEEGDELLGFASLRPSRDEDADRTTMEIDTIYLEPDAWGRGIARELLRTVLAAAPAGAAVTLWVPAANERARHFYRRHGFAPDGVEQLAQIGDDRLTTVRYRRR